MAKKQIYYRWVQDSEDAGMSGGPYGSIKEARTAAAEEVARDSSFTRLGVASVEVLIGPAEAVRCRAEDVVKVGSYLFEDVEEAVQNALGHLDDDEFESYYATGSQKSRAELLAFFKRWCPKHVEADVVRLDPKRSKIYSVKIPKQAHEAAEETALLEQHDVALAAVWADLQHRLSSAGKVALNQLRQEVQRINELSAQAQRLNPRTLKNR